jgi:hypothetical protein
MILGLPDPLVRSTDPDAKPTIISLTFLTCSLHGVQGDPVLLEVHAFQTRRFQGTAVETEEMRPQWFQEDQVDLYVVFTGV